MPKKISHKDQQRIWDEEHQNPMVLLQMDSKDASSGVTKLLDWLEQNPQYQIKKGIELGCGKGRNVIWLAIQGINVVGIDFSPAAIKEAQKRAVEAGVEDETDFKVQDATKQWPYEDNTFDLIIDCFATTDIESNKGRKAAVSKMSRVLKPTGLVLVYVMSSDDEYHAEMIDKYPAHEKNAFLHPTTGKYERAYDREELLDLYSGFEVLVEERVPKKATFFGKDYDCNHYWQILQNSKR